MSQTHDILNECKVKAEEVFRSASQDQSARDAALYIAHTGKGESIRQLAGATGSHPSTVSRAVKRIEDARDDPVFDHLISEAETETGHPCPGTPDGSVIAPPATGMGGVEYSAEDVRREAKRYLRRLSEPGAFMLIAQGTRKAGIFCAANAHKRPIAMVPVEIAAEFLKQDWIKAATRGSTSVRYRITDVGRSFLRRTLVEDQKTPAYGMAEAPSPFLSQHQEAGEKLFADATSGTAQPKRVNLGESPIGWLTRRKGADGKPFLKPEEIEAAEKLRTDFELAQIGPSVAQDWRKFLTPGDRLSGSPVAGDPGDGAMMARDRVMKALSALGPGLSDVVFRTCCFLEGLEACERRMGWSARSGKVVLQLALSRLAEHYGMIVFKD